MAKNKISEQQHTHLTIYGIRVPVTISFENRRNARISAATRNVYLRLPDTKKSRRELSDHLTWLTNWLQQLHKRKPGYLGKYEAKSYAPGVVIRLNNKEYVIRHDWTTKRNYAASFIGDQMIIHMVKHPSEDQQNNQHDYVRKAVIKSINRSFSAALKNRVNQLNLIHHKAPIEEVMLKYTRSKWGSCSHDGVIRLSTRLLLLHQVMIDYVILHELAHLMEFNHSERFWKVVASMDPAYLKKERWLNKHGHLYDF